MSNFTEKDLMGLLEELKPAEPILGAVLAVEWWQRGGVSLEVEVDRLDERGWEFAEDLLGEEGVELMKRHKGHKVIALPARDLDSLPKPDATDPTAIFTGARVYRLTQPPSDPKWMVFR